jgi:hypothetical protein
MRNTEPTRLVVLASLSTLGACALIALGCGAADETPAPSALGGGAGTGEAGDSAATEDWQRALAAAPNAAYSLSFSQAGPDSNPNDWDTLQVYMRASAFLGRAGSACEDFERHLDNGEPAELWVVRLETSHAQPGEYPIELEIHRPAPRPMSLARLERWQGGREVERRLASAGKITLTTVTEGLEGWPATKLVGEAELTFPVENVQSRGCTGTLTATSMAGECECVAGGKVFHCTTTPDQADCCQTATEGSYAVRIPIEASACSAMCQTSVPYEPSCGQL